MRLPSVGHKQKKIIYIVAAIVGAYILFSAGYQLAVYQVNSNQYLWVPHLNIGHTESSSCYGLPECGYQCPTMNPCIMPLKPAIYLYPPKEESVNIRLTYPAGFKLTVPTYDTSSGWTVFAKPNGSLINSKDNVTYPYLFWEGNPYTFNFDMTKGFIVNGANTRGFLEKELPVIGLNQQETNDFIAYWVPKLKHNPYNLIHFAGGEYTSIARLDITPKPSSILRVFMVSQSLQRPISVSPQTFSPFERSGFTIVEWGGAELGNLK